MKITDRKENKRKILCKNCGWQGYDTDCTSENEYGEDECPACNSTEFEILK